MKRLLLIAYYVPPAGGPAVQRVLQFVEHLPAADWAVEVLTVREGAYPNRDPTLAAVLPSDVRVHRTPALDPYALYQRFTGTQEGDLPTGSLRVRGGAWRERAARWIRANLFLPDARVGWVPFAVARARRLLATGRFDALVSTGAPHSVHLTGGALHYWTGLPWVADLHDPWTDICYYDDLPHTALARRLDAGLERTVLSGASAVTTVSPSWKALFERKADTDVFVVENGFRAADFSAVEGPPDDEFVLTHAGKLYAARNPTVLWDALARLRDENAIPQLRVQLVGTVAPAIRQALARRGLTPLVDHTGFLSHRAAVRRMARSTLLLLVIEDFAEADGMMTSKLGEYLASGRPVLGVGPPDGDASALLRRYDAGTMVGWNDREATVALVRRHYEAWAAGAPCTGADRDALTAHTRRAQAARMAQVLEAVTGRGSDVDASASAVLNAPPC
jgi:hypothetical protein